MITVPKSKILPTSAAVNTQDHLVLGGCDVVDLLQEYGSPLYVYDEATLRSTAEAYITAFRQRYPDTRIVYACKAFINLGLARLLAEYGLGFDVVSGGEIAVLRAAEVPPEGVFFHGNNKTPQELREAIEWGIGTIVIDSFHELELVEELAGVADRLQPVLIRVSPNVDAHTHHHTTTGMLDSKFGFPLETRQAKQAVRRAQAAPHLDLRGLHFHLGSPIFTLEPYREALDVVLRFASQMREEGLELRQFSPGGGFAVAHTEADAPPSADAYAEAIVGTLVRGCNELAMPEPELIVEPGRAITARAGVALYTVGAIKEVPQVRTFVSVDGGMGDNIRPALYGAQYEAMVANHVTQAATRTVTIAGKYCESGDILVQDAQIAPVSSGDIIAIPVSGAYGPSMASSYNLNSRPVMVLVDDGASRLIRRRESYADLMASDVT